jgi:acyl-CoA synthetase (AMP-forming)/AMP-acid ligase II
MRIEAGGQISSAVARYPNRVAFTTPQGSKTYKELDELGNRVASGLLSLGLHRGDRVGILSYNRLEVAALWFGMEKNNLIRVVLHSHFEFAIHVRTLNHIEANTLVFDTRFSTVVDEHRHLLKTVKKFVALGPNPPSWAIPFDKVVQKGNAGDPVLDLDEDAPCFLQLTTGTTGDPKPWIATYRSWRAVIEGNISHLDSFDAGSITSEDVSLHFHALQWATGFQTMMPYYLRGARTVLIDDETFDPGAIVDTIVAESVTGVFVPGPMLSPILDEIEKRGGISHRLKRIMLFFATPEQLERITRLLGPVWCHGFGSTEQGAPTTRLLPSDVSEDPARIESVGCSISPFFEIAIMNEAGERLPPGEIGEIVVRSPMSSSQYWNLPDKTDESFFPGGWFRPRDVGYVDKSGFVYFLDRAKDRIVTEAGVVYPHVIEAAVLRHSSVANCGVVGLGQPGSQRVVVGILLKEKGQPASDLIRAIHEESKAGLKAHEVPQELFFVDELPTVLGGAKVRREELRDQLTRKAGDR